MHRKIILNTILLFLFFIMQASNTADKKELQITITNINGEGIVYIGLYQQHDHFPKETSGKNYKIDPKGSNSVTIKIDDIEYGEYAAAIFHDKDGDGKMKIRILGIPDEPIGFSNNIKPRFSAPKFEKCKFFYNETSNTISIKLISL